MFSSTRTPVVYVVDDDPDVLNSLGFLLENDGFEVRTFRSGEALLSVPTAGSADCFVIDYRMPSMSGIELAELLRNRKIDAPIILITGYPGQNIRANAAASGIWRVLFKPLVDESLTTHIWNAINAGRLPAEFP
ncbi:MAG: response regulator [Bradyrhizobium sp.]|nr:response regulator [Bradyrhizobium sp.]